jgi:hypothetical protein
MKKLLLTTLAMAVATGAFAQGTILFNNRVAGSLITFVYQAGADNSYRSGNTAGSTPAGTTVYSGTLLTGGAWTASLWSLPGSAIPAGVNTPYGNIDNSMILAPQGGTTTFRTGTAAGNWATATATLGNVAADAANCVLQVRVFPTSFGTWANAVTAFNNGDPLAYIGVSPMFVVNAVGGGANTPPVMAGLVGFNVVAAPEPSSFALAGMGLASLLIFRRRK